MALDLSRVDCAAHDRDSTLIDSTLEVEWLLPICASWAYEACTTYCYMGVVQVN